MTKALPKTDRDGSSFQRSLAGYSTLAAAGACAVAVAPQANADIVYSGPMNFAVPATATGEFFNLLTFAMGTSFASVNGGDANAPVLNLWGTSAARAWLYPTSSAINRFVSNATNGPLELTAGTLINSSSVYGTSTQPNGLTGSGNPWTGSTDGYLGFKFLNGSTTEYGWAFVHVPAAGPTAADPIRLMGLAYENTGAGIAAGAVPEPGTVGLLAVGALGAGALAWRRRKSVAA